MSHFKINRHIVQVMGSNSEASSNFLGGNDPQVWRHRRLNPESSTSGRNKQFRLSRHGLRHGRVSSVVNDAHQEDEEQRADEVKQIHVDVVRVTVDVHRAHSKHLENEDRIEKHPRKVKRCRCHVRDGLILYAVHKSWNAKQVPELGASYFQKYPERIYQNLVTFYLCTGSQVNAEFFGLLTQQIKKI